MKAEIATIIIGIIAVFVSFLSYYCYIKSKLYRAADDAINAVEPEEDPIEVVDKGEQKLNAAIDQVYALIPAIMKPLINREMVKDIVQATFDKIESYAKKQIKKKSK